jgi:hypothetical protein
MAIGTDRFQGDAAGGNELEIVQRCSKRPQVGWPAHAGREEFEQSAA